MVKKMKKNNNLLIILLIVILAFIVLGSFNFMNVNKGSYLGFYSLNWVFAIIALIATIWVIYDVLANNKNLSNGMKILWIVCALLFSIITAVIYFLLGRNSKNDLFKT